MICPFDNTEVNPNHCENKRKAKPIIGMKNMFEQCQSCSIEIPTSKNNTNKRVRVKDDAPQKPKKLSKKEIAKKRIKLIREDSPIKSVGKVEKDIPFPKREGFFTYPFEEMEIGNSFEVKTKGKPDRQAQNSIITAARRFGIKYDPPRKFISTKTTTSIRVWRIE